MNQTKILKKVIFKAEIHTLILSCTEDPENKWAQQGQRPNSTKLQERTCGLHTSQKHMGKSRIKGNKTNTGTNFHTASINPSHKLKESDCTRSESSTVGHSCCHFRLIPATPNVINSTPRNKKICAEKKSRFIKFNNFNYFSWYFRKKCTGINVKDTLCSQCKLSGSRRATWNSAKSCNSWCSWLELLFFINASSYLVFVRYKVKVIQIGRLVDVKFKC